MYKLGWGVLEFRKSLELCPWKLTGLFLKLLESLKTWSLKLGTWNLNKNMKLELELELETWTRTWTINLTCICNHRKFNNDGEQIVCVVNLKVIGWTLESYTWKLFTMNLKVICWTLESLSLKVFNMCVCIFLLLVWPNVIVDRNSIWLKKIFLVIHTNCPVLCLQKFNVLNKGPLSCLAV